ncbi:hypothetical protein TSAR_015128 [Trichomalopsis sarcophagae]|uniref:Uncharacterized protein n=1 Tax=Trichomalopsis sarcophagae TaxID=543379 RepID=A0A232ES38_9HYME|nr:hypothetical protein TSAR_015128 [Trichomalopsis sarcophagae]
MTPEVVVAFDKAKVSDRDTVFITSLVAHALNINVNIFILNRKSINIARAEIRKTEFEKMKQIILDTSDQKATTTALVIYASVKD